MKKEAWGIYGRSLCILAAVLLTVNLCAAAYCVIEKQSVRIYGSALIGFAISAAEFVFILSEV